MNPCWTRCGSRWSQWLSAPAGRGGWTGHAHPAPNLYPAHPRRAAVRRHPAGDAAGLRQLQSEPGLSAHVPARGVQASVSILHTFRNLARMQLASGRAQPVFAGQDAVFPVLLTNTTRLPRFSIGLQRPGRPDTSTWTPARSLRLLRKFAFLRTSAGGWLWDACAFSPRFRSACSTPGPTWSWMRSAWSTRSPSRAGAAAAAVAGSARGVESGTGQDDFAGLRKYQPGDSLRHVAWKAVARGQPILTKQFSGLAEGELWLEWDACRANSASRRGCRDCRAGCSTPDAPVKRSGCALPSTQLRPASGRSA